MVQREVFAGIISHMTRVKLAPFVAALSLCASLQTRAQTATSPDDFDSEAGMMRGDYAHVDAVAHIRNQKVRIVNRMGGKFGYVFYRVTGRVIEPFKERVRRGQILSYYGVAEAGFSPKFPLGDRIVFLHAERIQGKWAYSELENSAHGATPENLAAVRRAQADARPDQRVRQFLRFHLAREDGLDTKSLNLRQGWLSPQLLGLLRHEIQRDAAYRVGHPNDAPFFEGDIWTNSQEEISGFRALAPTRRASVVSVPVKFQVGSQTSTGIYKLRLVQGEWRIEDVVFGRESLSKLLQRPSYAG